MHRFRFFHPLNLVVMVYGAEVDDRGLRDHLLTVYDQPDFVPGMDEINVFLDTRTVRVTGSGLRDIARMLPRPGHENAPRNLVGVVTDTDLGYGLTRLYGAHAEMKDDRELTVCATVAEAAAWLDEQRGRTAGTTAALVEEGAEAAPAVPGRSLPGGIS